MQCSCILCSNLAERLTCVEGERKRNIHYRVEMSMLSCQIVQMDPLSDFLQIDISQIEIS